MNTLKTSAKHEHTEEQLMNGLAEKPWFDFLA